MRLISAVHARAPSAYSQSPVSFIEVTTIRKPGGLIESCIVKENRFHAVHSLLFL